MNDNSYTVAVLFFEAKKKKLWKMNNEHQTEEHCLQKANKNGEISRRFVFDKHRYFDIEWFERCQYEYKTWNCVFNHIKSHFTHKVYHKCEFVMIFLSLFRIRMFIKAIRNGFGIKMLIYPHWEAWKIKILFFTDHGSRSG